MSEAGEDYDIAFIEGSITTDNDVKRIKRIREKAKAIISLGACATIGGVNGMKTARLWIWPKSGFMARRPIA